MFVLVPSSCSIFSTCIIVACVCFIFAANPRTKYSRQFLIDCSKSKVARYWPTCCDWNALCDKYPGVCLEVIPIDLEPSTFGFFMVSIQDQESI